MAKGGKEMIITPHISEKSYALAKDNIYIFEVPISANKAEVTRELKADYPDVEIKDVRLMVAKGKAKSFSRGKRSRPGKTNLKDTKKAYVTVSKGRIKVFDDNNESEEK